MPVPAEHNTTWNKEQHEAMANFSGIITYIELFKTRGQMSYGKGNPAWLANSEPNFLAGFTLPDTNHLTFLKIDYSSEDSSHINRTILAPILLLSDDSQSIEQQGLLLADGSFYPIVPAAEATDIEVSFNSMITPKQKTSSYLFKYPLRKLQAVVNRINGYNNRNLRISYHSLPNSTSPSILSYNSRLLATISTGLVIQLGSYSRLITGEEIKDSYGVASNDINRLIINPRDYHI